MLVNVTLRLLLNLSFDPKLRQDMVKLALLPKFGETLSESGTLNVMYNINSMLASPSGICVNVCMCMCMCVLYNCMLDIYNNVLYII